MENYKGFLITGEPILCNNFVYDGIECNPWPVNDGLLCETLTSEQLDLIQSQIDDLNIKNEVGLLDLDAAKIYISACKRYKIWYSIKFVEVVRNGTLNTIDDKVFSSLGDSYYFWGYDVGVCAYDYFSSVLTDIIWRPSLFGVEILNKLNPKGLFDNYDDASAFLKQRNVAITKDTELNFEKCKVDIMKIYKICL